MITKDEEVVQEIKRQLMTKLKKQFGYYGIAETNTSIIINSGNKNIMINIKWE